MVDLSSRQTLTEHYREKMLKSENLRRAEAARQRVHSVKKGLAPKRSRSPGKVVEVAAGEVITPEACRMARPKPFLLSGFRDAELNAAEWMRYMGFNDATATPLGVDGGLDVVASGAVAQVKAEATASGAEALQRLVGTAQLPPHRGKACLFFSSAGYTRSAVSYALGVGLALFIYDGFGDMAPSNEYAGNLIPAP